MSTQPSQAVTLLTTDAPPIHLIQIPELIEKAATSRGLTIKKYRDEGGPEFETRKFETGVIGTYKLDEGLLKALGKVSFTFEPGVNPPHDTMIYLSGHSNQKGQDVFETDCWCWERMGEAVKDPQLAVYLELSVDERERGIVTVPKVGGNWSGGACHRPTINKFVIAIAGYFLDAHPLLKELTTDSYPIIGWDSIGLGGIRSVSHLFKEWRWYGGHNELISALMNSDISPFSPAPSQAGYNYFVAEPEQPKLFRQWQRQLREFKNQLY